MLVPRLAQIIANEFAALPQVVALALAGSRINEADESSDFDFYVYVCAEIPTNVRADTARKFATRIEINNQFWETGDEWIDTNSGCVVDVMYRTRVWIEEQLDMCWLSIKHPLDIQPAFGGIFSSHIVSTLQTVGINSYNKKLTNHIQNN